MPRNKKYQTEFCVNSFGSLCVLAQQDGLRKLEQSGFNEENPCHIYMIARRPRIMIDPTSIRIERDYIYGQFLIQEGGEITSEKFAISNLAGRNLRFECPYPHTEYFFYDEKDAVLASGKTALLLQSLQGDFSKYLSLEVLYVGQSYGVEGVRSAPQRLQNHSTLQEIYAEAIRKTPDKEIWLVLWGFTPTVLLGIDGISKTFDKSDDEDNLHIRKFYNDFISEQQLINFTEAALIRYFEPAYNQIFKNTFPNPAHSTYSDCYNLDIYSVNVELQTEEINCQLYSPKVAPKWVHLASFILHNSRERKSYSTQLYPTPLGDGLLTMPRLDRKVLALFLCPS